MNYYFSVGKIDINNTTLYESAEITIPVRGITVVVGSNGCGKTTLLNHMMYLNPERIALIAQENDLIFHEMSIEDNIMLFGEDKEKFSELLRLFEIEYIVDRKPRHLSGGEKRIIALLRMFFVDKDIVFLDEPTNDLDYRAVEKVKTIISQLATQKAVLIVTHDERIASIADKTYCFCDGKILSKEDPHEKVYREITKKEAKNTIGNLVRREIVGNLLFAFVLISVIASGLVAIIMNVDKIDYLKEKQTNIASRFYAGLDLMISEGYIPLQAYKCYAGEINEDFLEAYYESLKVVSSQGGSLNMFVDKQLGEEVYLTVFFDAITNKKTYVMQDYQRLRKEQTGKKPDISKYISVFDGVNEVADIPKDGMDERIDPSLYYMLEEAYIEEYSEYQPVLYVVMGINEVRLTDLEGNIFIKNNTTVDICNAINAMRVYMSSLTVLGIGLIGSLLFYFLYVCIGIKLYRNHIVVFRNLGVSQDEVTRELFRKKGAPMIKMSMIGTGLLMCIVGLYFYTNYTLVITLVAFLSLIVGVGVIVTTRRILDKNIEKIYNYGGLYEDKN